MVYKNSHQFDAKTLELIYGCLDRVLGSVVFTGSPRLQRFFQYLVDKFLSGESSNLKGYTIGVEVFDRGPGFDPSVDSIVRTESVRLRAKLDEYYRGEGCDCPYRFKFVKGGYSIEVVAMEREFTSDDNEKLPLPIQPVSSRNVAPGSKPVLAVLPFSHYSADPENMHSTFFSDSIPDSLILELSNAPGLTVISRQSSFAFRNQNLRADEIGEQLGARYLLDGTVHRHGSRVRIMVQLVDTATSGCIWAERYDRENRNTFEVQDEIVKNVIRMLNIKLLPPDPARSASHGTISTEAYDCFMRGLELHWIYTQDTMAEAIRLYEEALAHDPDYALVYSWLSRALTFQWIMGWEDRDHCLDLAYQHARSAIQLNKYLPNAHMALGWAELWRGNGPEAIAACRHAVSLDQNSAEGLMFLSICLSASDQGDEALRYIKMGMWITSNPSPFHYFALGLAHCALRQFNLAESAWKQGCELDSNFVINHYYWMMLHFMMSLDQESFSRQLKLIYALGGDIPQIREPWLDPAIKQKHLPQVRREVRQATPEQIPAVSALPKPRRTPPSPAIVKAAA